MSIQEATQQLPQADKELNSKDPDLNDSLTDIKDKVEKIRDQVLQNECSNLLERCETLVTSSNKSATDNVPDKKESSSSIDIKEDGELASKMEELEDMFKETMREELSRFEILCDDFIKLANEDGIESASSVIDQIIDKNILSRSAFPEDSDGEDTPQEGSSSSVDKRENEVV